MSKPEQTPEAAETTAAPLPQADALRLPMVRAASAVQPPRSSARRLWFRGLGMFLAAVVGFGHWLQPWAAGPVPVSIESAAFAPVTRVLAVNGRIAALHSVDVRALVSGPLEAVLVAEGEAVRPGQALARIDAAAQKAILRQAVAGLDAALVVQEQASTILARTETLGQNVARTVLEKDASAVRAAAQDVARMTALVDQAQIQLGNFTISAPMEGIILELNVDPGQTVDPATVLLTVADLSQLLAETDVDEAYATQIHAGLPAVLLLAGEAVPRNGQVSFVSQRVDAATGGLAVKLSFDEAVIAPVGLTVTANIVVDQQDAALTVPRAAILSADDQDAVFVVSDGLATRRSVTVIDWPAARLIVTEGLASGDPVILDATGITDGQAVREDQP